jgi:starvation-inducible DNA-binding protein
VSIRHTVKGLDEPTSQKVVDVLQQRLVALVDLQLTLKHVHWNVTGPNFIAVHEMLDPQTELVRGATDEMAERIATLGGTPNGLPGNLVATRTWQDYGIGTAEAQEHLEQLVSVFDGVIEDHRNAREAIADLDPVTEDLLIAQLGQLEQAQWFVRAHLESSG